MSIPIVYIEDMVKEYWKELNLYLHPLNHYTRGRYSISNFGRIKTSYRGDRILNPGQNGYVFLGGFEDKAYVASRLVAMHFLEMPRGKRCPKVLFKDGDRTNLRVDNLKYEVQTVEEKRRYKREWSRKPSSKEKANKYQEKYRREVLIPKQQERAKIRLEKKAKQKFIKELIKELEKKYKKIIRDIVRAPIRAEKKRLKQKRQTAASLKRRTDMRENHPELWAAYLKKSRIRHSKWKKKNPDKMKEYRKRHNELNQKHRATVLKHYGGQCKCGCSNQRALTMSRIKLEFGKYMPPYAWYIKNDFPDGYIILCRNCVYIRLLDVTMKNTIYLQNAQYRQRIRSEVIEHYSKGKNCCARCEEKRLRALSVDHVNNDGNKHREKIGSSAVSLISFLKKNNYPDGYQVLCANCNWVKYLDSK